MLDKERLARSFRLVLSLASFASFVSLAPAVVREWLKYAMASAGNDIETWIELFSANTAERVPVLLPNETRTGRFLYIGNRTPSHFLPLWSFFPVCFYFYLTRKHFPLKASVLSVFTMLLIMCIGFGYFGNALILITHVLQAWCLFAVVLKCSLPSNSHIPKQMAYQVMIVVMGQIGLEGLKFLPTNQEWFVLVLFGVIYPVIREMTRFLATQSAWYLSSQADIGGRISGDLDRKHAWVFVGYVQIFWAVYYRLQVANIQNPMMSWGIVMWQALLEITMRLTVRQRDTFMKKVLKRFRRGGKLQKRLTKVVSLNTSAFNQSKSILDTATNTDDTAGDADRAFYSMVILTEMMAEYTGIVAACFVIAFWRDHVLFVPFQYYTSVPLDSPQNLTPLFVSAVMQWFAEIVVDVICTCHERKTNPHNAWEAFFNDRKSFIFLYAFASLVGGEIAVTIVQFGDSFNACKDRDMCYCVNNGLVGNGVRETYCKLIYPNSSGVVPQ